MNKRFQRGEIGTILAIGALVVLSISVFVSSVFLKNQKQTTSSRAAGICVVNKVEKIDINGTKVDINCKYSWDSEATKKLLGTSVAFCGGETSPEFQTAKNNNLLVKECEPVDNESASYCSATEKRSNGEICNLSWYGIRGCSSAAQAEVDRVNNYNFERKCYFPADPNYKPLPPPNLVPPPINPNPTTYITLRTQCTLWKTPPVEYSVSTNAGDGKWVVVRYVNGSVIAANAVPVDRSGGYEWSSSAEKGKLIAELRDTSQNGPIVATSAESDQDNCQVQVCAQVETPMRNKYTLECKINSSACIPDGWYKDEACRAIVQAPVQAPVLLPAPSAPTNLSCAIDTLAKTATFKWDAVSAETSYEIMVTELNSQGQSLGKAPNTISRSKGVTNYQMGNNCTDCKYDWQVVAIGTNGQKGSPAKGQQGCSVIASAPPKKPSAEPQESSQIPVCAQTSQTLPFKDISSSTEANLYKAILCFGINSNKACIINGYDNNDFCSKNGGVGSSCFLPNRNITRAEALTLITRYHITILNDWNISNTLSVSFPDVDSHWAKQQISQAYKSGFTLGVVNESNFNPDGEWKYGFKGVTASQYANGTFPEVGPMTRGDFLKQLYSYAAANSQGKITENCGTVQTTSGGSTSPDNQPAPVSGNNQPQSGTSTVSCPHKAQGDADCNDKIDADDILIWILQLNKRENPKPGRDARFDDKSEVAPSHFNMIRRNFLKGTPGKPW